MSLLSTLLWVHSDGGPHLTHLILCWFWHLHANVWASSALYQKGYFLSSIRSFQDTTRCVAVHFISKSSARDTKWKLLCTQLKKEQDQLGSVHNISFVMLLLCINYFARLWFSLITTAEPYKKASKLQTMIWHSSWIWMLKMMSGCVPSQIPMERT